MKLSLPTISRRLLALVLAGSLVSCSSPPPPKIVHVNATPEVARLLRHPALKLVDPSTGRWVKGEPVSAESAWSGENGRAPSSADLPPGNGAGVALLMIIGGTFVANAVHSVVAPSASQISQARAGIAKGIEASSWRTAFHNAFAAEARRHGVTNVECVAQEASAHGADALIEVRLTEVGIGQAAKHPVVHFAWGVRRDGNEGSVWWGGFDLEAPAKKSFMEWGADGGQALAKTLRDLFQKGGTRLAKELYEGTEVAL